MAEPERPFVRVAYDQIAFWSVVRIVATAGGGVILASFLLLGSAAMLGAETVRFAPAGSSFQQVTGIRALLVAGLFGLGLASLFTLAFALGWALLRALSPLPGIKILLGRDAGTP